MIELTSSSLARKMDVARTRIERIAEKKTGVTADTALRLSKALGTTPQLWLHQQTEYDLQIALRALGKKLAKIGAGSRGCVVMSAFKTLGF